MIKNRFANLLVADGFDDAIIGVTASGPNRPAVVVYDYESCIRILMEREGWSWRDAVEFFDYNVVGAFVGQDTPIFVHRGEPE